MTVCFDLWHVIVWIIMCLISFMLCIILYYLFEKLYVEIDIKRLERKLNKIRKRRNGE